MFNVCYQCGAYRADKIIDPEGPFAICPECGFRHPFRRLPLLVIGGASGAGKSSVMQQLLGRLDASVLLEGDLLWQPEFNTPEDSYRKFFETWLRMAKNIGQAGRAVTIFNAGMGVPANLSDSVERRYFSSIHTLGLVCEDGLLAARLNARPAWRQSGQKEWIVGQIDFNHWYREQGPAVGVELLDTSNASPVESARQVADWIRAHLA